jgi:hypothetical protein
MTEPDYEAVGRHQVLTERFRAQLETYQSSLNALERALRQANIVGEHAVPKLNAEQVLPMAQNIVLLHAELTRLANEINLYAPSAGKQQIVF